MQLINHRERENHSSYEPVRVSPSGRRADYSGSPLLGKGILLKLAQISLVHAETFLHATEKLCHLDTGEDGQLTCYGTHVKASAKDTMMSKNE